MNRIQNSIQFLGEVYEELFRMDVDDKKVADILDKLLYARETLKEVETIREKMEKVF